MHRPSPVLRIAAVCQVVAWLAVLAPAPGSAVEEAEPENPAAEEPAAEPATEPAAERAAEEPAAEREAEKPAAEGSAAEAEAEKPAPEPLETGWQDTAVRNANVAIDLVFIRPLAAVTLGAGAVLLVPAAVMTAPNGWDSVKDAYQTFVAEPTEYLISRPLGEF